MVAGKTLVVATIIVHGHQVQVHTGRVNILHRHVLTAKISMWTTRSALVEVIEKQKLLLVVNLNQCKVRRTLG